MTFSDRSTSLIYFFSDILIIVASYVIALFVLPLTAEAPFEKYRTCFLIYLSINLVVGLFLWKYSPTMMGRKCLFARIFYPDLISIFLFILLIQKQEYRNLSINVLFSVSAVSFLLEMTFFWFFYSLREVKLDKKQVVIDNSNLSSVLSEKVYNFVKKYVPEDVEVNVQNNGSVLDVLQMDNKLCFVHTQRFNKIKEPNLFLSVTNQKIDEGGYFIGHFETKNARKKRILDSKPFGVNFIYYAYDFLFKRFFPYFYLTAPFFTQLYKKIDRVYSKTEVYGRFYCAGFEFIRDIKLDGKTYFIFKKVGKPQRYKETNIGLLIGLNRIGKDGNKFVEYKLRTMYPYSEFLQSYMIKYNTLREGGKIRRDVRITRFGAISRRLWLDELPQFINLFKGDIKLVGVRPLSQAYFNLYSKELQDLRIQFKPGMLPPFYADMPKTLDEIQNSEMKYLTLCKENGVLKTDIKYLWLIFKNIVFKRARSH